MPLLSAMLHAGIDAPYSCGSGRCGSCTCKLEKGEVRLMRNSVLSETHIQQGPDLGLCSNAHKYEDKDKL